MHFPGVTEGAFRKGFAYFPPLRRRGSTQHILYESRLHPCRRKATQVGIERSFVITDAQAYDFAHIVLEVLLVLDDAPLPAHRSGAVLVPDDEPES